MFKVLNERHRQGYRTISWPDGDPPKLPERFRGLPVIDAAKCPDGCREVCRRPARPTRSRSTARLSLIWDAACSAPTARRLSRKGRSRTRKTFDSPSRTREGLVLDGTAFQLAEALDDKSRRIFGRSLQLRQVSAGGCNACEADINVLTTVVFDLSRFGISIVASPRHADGLIITGPVTENMKLALQKTYDATPAPKIVIAVGACAISGGPFVDHPEQNNGADSVVPVDLYIPGCPPHPMTILDGLLRLLGRIEDGTRRQPT